MTVIKSEVKKVDLDDVLSKFSNFGPYHVQCMVLIFLAYVSNTMYCSNYIFAAEEVEYRCEDEEYANTSCTNIHNCSTWIYENPHSFVAEFQIACQEWKRTLVGTAHSFGYMVGLLLVGPMSDRIGRKKAVVMTGVMGGILGLAKSFSLSYWLYIVLEFLESAIGDICSPAYILNIEIVSTKKRVLYYILCAFGYTLGGFILPAVAWAVPYWRDFLRVIYAPALLFFLYLFLLDESPRWLLIKGKKDKAIAVIERAANKNNMKIDKSLLDRLTCEKENNVGFLNLLKITFSSKALVKRCIICIIWWTTSTFVNYGLTINSVSLPGNKYVNFALLSAVDIPGTVIITFVLMYFKRKISLIFSFIIGGMLCLMQPFLPANLVWLSTLVYMFGKLMCSFYFTLTYMYTSELFPTYTRNSMHALCSSVGRIGAIIAPQTPLLISYWPGFPSFVFGGAAFIAGLVTFLVPDTSEDSLPDTVHQAETIGCKTPNEPTDLKILPRGDFCSHL